MPHQDRDGGFTLVEVMVAIVLLGIMMAIAVGGFSSWAKASAHSGTAREVQTVMRQAQQRAVTEGLAMCVWFDVAANTYTVYRGACDSPAKQHLTGPHQTESPDVRLAAPAFPSAASPGVTLYARGTAVQGSVKVTRTGSTKQYVITVEGLTGRVSLS